MEVIVKCIDRFISREIAAVVHISCSSNQGQSARLLVDLGMGFSSALAQSRIFSPLQYCLGI